jgi:hypothetical protein
VATETDGTSRIIVCFHVNPIPDSLEHANRFTLQRKGGIQYFVLALFVLVLFSTIYVVVLCARTREPKGKWFCHCFQVGIGKFVVNRAAGMDQHDCFYPGSLCQRKLRLLRTVDPHC